VLDIEKGAQAWFSTSGQAGDEHSIHSGQRSDAATSSTATTSSPSSLTSATTTSSSSSAQSALLSRSPPTTIDSEFLHVTTSEDEEEDAEDEELDDASLPPQQQQGGDQSDQKSWKSETAQQCTPGENGSGGGNSSSKGVLSSTPRTITTSLSSSSSSSSSSANRTDNSTPAKTPTQERGHSQFMEARMCAVVACRLSLVICFASLVVWCIGFEWLMLWPCHYPPLTPPTLTSPRVWHFLRAEHTEMSEAEIEALRAEVGSEWHAKSTGAAECTSLVNIQPSSTDSVHTHSDAHAHARTDPHQPQRSIGVPMVLARRQETVLQTKLQNLNVERNRLEKSIEKLQKNLIETMKDVEDLVGGLSVEWCCCALPV
jgi:hypothetical protein